MNREQTVIFYGAGRYAARNLERWKSEGLTPVCFADAGIRKHGTQFGGYDIISLQAAVETYPNYVLYITLAHDILKEARDSLLSAGIPDLRIRFADKVERRFGCDNIGTCLNLVTNKVYLCAYHGVEHNEDYSFGYSSFDDAEQKYIEHSERLLNLFREGRAAACEKCPMNKDGWYSARPQIETVILGSGFADDVCNYRCSYCVIRRDYKPKEGEYVHKFSDIFEDFAKSYHGRPIHLSLANREMTVNPLANYVFDTIAKEPWSLEVVTNCSTYNDKICRMAFDGKPVNICVSLDAGTSETYTKVKAADRYETVIENLRRYNNAGVKIYLKFILLPGTNDTEDDITGFIGVCRELRPDTVMITLDRYSYGNTDNHGMKLLLRIVSECKAMGLTVSANDFHLGGSARDSIGSAVKAEGFQ
jgi:pyruvate-formate lyase-activating enzyme